MIKVKDWLLQKKGIQFKVIFRDKSGQIETVDRIKDGNSLVLHYRFKSDNAQHFFIERFYENLIHIDYVINPGVIKGTCEINDLIIEKTRFNGLIVRLSGQIDKPSSTMVERDTSLYYSD